MWMKRCAWLTSSSPGVDVEVERLVLTDIEVCIALRSRAASAACPECGQRSPRVHCYYERCLADRPVAGRRVRIELRARRLVCENASCTHRMFAEQIPGLTRRHARRAQSLTALLTDVALFPGGRPEPGCPSACPSRPARTLCSG
ncbi:hypothetical protein GCM10009574_094470 [Streptomyces asiaticus]